MAEAAAALQTTEVLVATALAFLRFLFADALERDERAHVGIVTLPGGVTERFQDLVAAARYAIERSIAGLDVYVATALQMPLEQAVECKRRKGKEYLYGRDDEEDVLGVVALYSDVDVVKPTSKKKRFPNQEKALAFVRSLPRPPTVIVASGTGYHLWWLLREPLFFDDAEEREQAIFVSKGWVAYLQRKAADEHNGVVLDSVGDLAHILRCPGTLHTETGNIVKII